MSNYRLIQGDCIELMQTLPDNSIDLVLCDLPYNKTHNFWDSEIDFEKLWNEYNRIIKEHGAIVLFGQTNFSARLIMSNEKLFRYTLIWNKVRKTGFLNANRMPLRQHEDILVFYKKLPTYNPQMQEGGEPNHSRGKKWYSKGNVTDKGNHYGAYNHNYPVSKRTTKYPSSILTFPNKVQGNLHPTQKPVALLEYLIKTYTNEGDTVLDNCMGSGSTGVACVNTNRNFIGMELSSEYYDIAKDRIEKVVWWLSMSNYRLMQGDCIELMQSLPNNSVDLIVTDPPYEHVMGGMKSKKYNIGTWKADSYVNMKMSQFKKKDIFRFLDTAIPKMKKTNMFVFCSRLQLAHYFDYLNQHKKLKYDLLVWDKSSKDNKYSMKSSMFYTSDIEYVLRIYESGVHLFKVLTEDKSKSDYRYYMKRQKFAQPKGLHESMKPVELLERYIKVSTNKGDTVLDCFMGSGSTGVAALKLDRNFIGIELNEHYFDTATKRIERINAKVVKKT